MLLEDLEFNNKIDSSLGYLKDVFQNAKTILASSDCNDDLLAYAKHRDVLALYYIMPGIKSVSVVNGEASAVVIIRFCDGTSEKAVVSEGDSFDLEQGISICITKKLLSMRCPNGSNLYNKIVKKALNTYKKQLRDKEKADQEQKEEIDKRKRKREKREQKRINREAKEREKQIEIQKEAYLRAMREYNDGAETEAG